MNPKDDTVVVVRSCGDCAACCTALAVTDVPKMESERCPNEKATAGTRRCTIYETRPKPCQTFRCEWLNGSGTQEDRPDRSGLVPCFTETKFGPTVQLFEVRINAYLEHRNHAIIANMVAKGLIVIIMRKDFRRILARPDLLQKIQAVMDKPQHQQ